MRSKRIVARGGLGVFALVFCAFVFVFSLIFGGVNVSAAGEWEVTNRTQGISGVTGNNFYPVTVSGTGQHMYSAAHSQGIFISNDYGVTWYPTPNFTPQDYWGITTSYSGQIVYAAGIQGDIWFSNDYGINWTKRTSAPQTGYYWATIKTSYNGQHVIVGTEQEGVLISNDYGATFTPTSLPTDHYYYGVTISSDGNFLMAAELYGSVYVSSDGGSTWDTTSLGDGPGYFEAGSSATGQYLAVVVPGGGIYTSSDFGVNWVNQAGAGTLNWYDVEISASGQYLAAVAYGGDIWASSDYGVTWVNQTGGSSSESLNYQFVDISDDGKYIISGVQEEDVYVGVNNSIGLPVAQTVSPTSSEYPLAPKTGNGTNISSYLYSLAVFSSILMFIGIHLSKSSYSLLN